MSAHTPGPWHLSGANTVHGADCIVAFVGTDCEEVRRFSGPRQEADALLIAAAPDLLEALCAFVNECECSPEDMTVDAWALARAAIAKARGK